MPRFTPSLLHQGVMMFHTTPPFGVPRRGITTPPFLPIMFSGVSASQRGNQAQDYRGEMNVPAIRTVVPNHREHYWQERGGRYSPPRNTERWCSMEHHNPLMKERRGKARHTPILCLISPLTG
jgi:hypothetical protein